MDYEKYRQLENWVDKDAIALEQSNLDALRDTKERLEEQINQLECEISGCRNRIRKLQSAGHNAAYDQFKVDALEEAGLAGHPKADKLFERAWDRGHSGGYNEVMYELEELASLID